MKPTEPLALNHSWPVFERGVRFDMGCLDVPHGAWEDADNDWLASHGIGRWHCDLSTSHLTWSTGMYPLFGWQLDQAPDRAAVLPLYQSESRAAVEKLRAYAIRHRRGFTIDADLRISGVQSWVRVTGIPVCQGERVVALQGWKWDVTAEYC